MQTLPTSQHEHSACGVGFIANRHNQASHDMLQQALKALAHLEHRGACASDRQTSDGAGVMTDIPYDMLGIEEGKAAIANLFLPRDGRERVRSLEAFEQAFTFLGMNIREYREVPINAAVLGPLAKETLPVMRQAIIERPSFCTTRFSFDRRLHIGKQAARTRLNQKGIKDQFTFCSISSRTIVYKALTTADKLADFYPDLLDPAFVTRFAVFHRRFSTNTSSSWDRAQPFRLLGHNGEINTIAGNRSWSFSREMSMGIPESELLTHEGISDSGSFNEMVEAMKFRSSMTKLRDILAIMVPPADQESSFYQFWGRAMEPWDGPALMVYADGESVGARLDRNGFRPCRWTKTSDTFYLASEAGPFEIDESLIEQKGALSAGAAIEMDLLSGSLDLDASAKYLKDNTVTSDYDPQLRPLKAGKTEIEPAHLERKLLFGYTKEDMDKILLPMITSGKEPIGSMGDTARPAMLSDVPRGFFDFFYQNFAQVTNPPLDYLRESAITDLRTYLGAKPNLFSPVELIPPEPAFVLDSPILSLAQMAHLRQEADGRPGLRYRELHTLFDREAGPQGLKGALDQIEQQAVKAAEEGITILILTDRKANSDQPPIPSLLALRAAVQALNNSGLRLRTSIIVHSGEIRETHHIGALISYGSAAVCPYLALEIARYENNRKLNALEPEKREANLVEAFTSGLLKIMAKMGISVVRSYQSAKLFTPMGLSHQITDHYFPGLDNPIGGLTLAQIAENILKQTHPDQLEISKLPNTFQYKEHNKEAQGERHNMTNNRSKLLHKLVRENHLPEERAALYQTYADASDQGPALALRHLLRLKPDTVASSKQPELNDILRRFGSGAMSFGAISAESQRDIILAMQEIGGRSNSGEGGENPYYFSQGITASTKQIASGRFGVTSEYLITAEEFQIKMAQGAKPGEGGQLMGVKVTADIARARHSTPGVDLISPPPMHDIYSIEDLKELIYELKQFNPATRVSVKLVAGTNIGTIAVGVAKAGADIIQISGGDGGTGAASLSSMKHAGLPWELGLMEVHRSLVKNQLRDHITLRVDGGLHTGRDIAIAAAMGAQEFDFGKYLLVAQGCVMARICEKNTCPTGIATHNPKFKAKYIGTKEHVVEALTLIAEHVVSILKALGLASLDDLVGRTDLIELDPAQQATITSRGFNLDFFTGPGYCPAKDQPNLFADQLNPLNARILEEAWHKDKQHETSHLYFDIHNTDRGILSTLAGEMARAKHQQRQQVGESDERPYGKKTFTFKGSAGQGFAAFLMEGTEVMLWGEANDSVAKSMSGGRVVIRPAKSSSFDAHQNAIIGNCALYGATGGALYVNGRAGDRFAVRNSGALAIAEGAGMHACEYMTGGTVILLSSDARNIGAGMTGGQLYIFEDQKADINNEYLVEQSVAHEDEVFLKQTLQDYIEATSSRYAHQILDEWSIRKLRLRKYLPIQWLAIQEADHEAEGARTIGA